MNITCNFRAFLLQIVYLDWWPVSRDSLMYAISVIALIATLQDGVVMWYEALALVMAYLIYIAGKKGSKPNEKNEITPKTITIQA